MHLILATEDEFMEKNDEDSPDIYITRSGRKSKLQKHYNMMCKHG
jgi:hypothetical protein